MRIWLRSLAVLVVAVGCSAQSPVEGRWRSLSVSKGGIGAIFVFGAGGVAEFSPGAVVESEYRVEGDELVLPSPTVKGPQVRQKIAFPREGLLRLQEPGGRGGTVLTRQGGLPDAANPLLGEWTGKSEMNGQSFPNRWFFYAGGKSLFLLPFTTTRGRYSVTGGSIRVELPGRPVLEGAYGVEGDVLSLPSRGGGVDRYGRF